MHIGKILAVSEITGMNIDYQVVRFLRGVLA